MQQGFDYAYDKTLYDRRSAATAAAVREHLRAGLDYQRPPGPLPREPRRAARRRHLPAGRCTRPRRSLAFLTPGLRFFHQGQFEGRRKRVSIHLDRAPAEPPDPAVGAFYARLLEVLQHPALRDGAWRLLEPTEAWPGNWKLGRLRLLRLGGPGRGDACWAP